MTTKLEKGVFVKISPEQLKVLMQDHKGFLSWESYPDNFKLLMVDGEIGRFNIFRLILEKS